MSDWEMLMGSFEPEAQKQVEDIGLPNGNSDDAVNRPAEIPRKEYRKDTDPTLGDFRCRCKICTGNHSEASYRHHWTPTAMQRVSHDELAAMRAQDIDPGRSYAICYEHCLTPGCKAHRKRIVEYRR